MLDAATSPKPSLCHGHRVYGQDYLYECKFQQCPILWADDLCPLRLDDDDPNPLDEMPPDA